MSSAAGWWRHPVLLTLPGCRATSTCAVLPAGVPAGVTGVTVLEGRYRLAKFLPPVGRQVACHVVQLVRVVLQVVVFAVAVGVLDPGVAVGTDGVVGGR